METAISTLSVLPVNRDEQHRFANKMIEELMNGEHDLIKVWQQMSIIADTLNEIKDSVTLRQSVIKEVEKYGKEGATVNGCTLTVGRRRSWDYSGCNDSVWAMHKQRVLSFTNDLKEREKFLQNLKPGMIAVDEQTGEQLNPPMVSVTEFITVK